MARLANIAAVSAAAENNSAKIKTAANFIAAPSVLPCSPFDRYILIKISLMEERYFRDMRCKIGVD